MLPVLMSTSPLPPKVELVKKPNFIVGNILHIWKSIFSIYYNSNHLKCIVVISTFIFRIILYNKICWLLAHKHCNWFSVLTTKHCEDDATRLYREIQSFKNAYPFCHNMHSLRQRICMQNVKNNSITQKDYFILF